MEMKEFNSPRIIEGSVNKIQITIIEGTGKDVNENIRTFKGNIIGDSEHIEDYSTPNTDYAVVATLPHSIDKENDTEDINKNDSNDNNNNSRSFDSSINQITSNPETLVESSSNEDLLENRKKKKKVVISDDNPEEIILYGDREEPESQNIEGEDKKTRIMVEDPYVDRHRRCFLCRIRDGGEPRILASPEALHQQLRSGRI